MAWTRAKANVVAGAAGIALLLGVGYFVFFRLSAPAGKLNLPTGPVAPEISFAGYYGTILASDGSLWAWGDQDLGWPVLGLPGVKHTVSLRPIGGGTDWVSVSAGTYHVLAIKSNGTLWAWGANFRGQLGDGTITTRATPTPSVPGNDWKQAVAAGAHSLAIKKDGTLWAWGDNWAGQLGTGTVTDSPTEAQVGSASNWTRIWANNVVSVGQQTDGSLWRWGILDQTSATSDRLLVPTRVSAETNWADVSFGDSEVFAIKTDGTLWVWGREAEIYTGASGKSSNTVPTRAGTDHDWKAGAHAGGYYHVLMKKDGSLWALDASADHNPRGGLTPAKLQRIDLQKEIVAIAAGRDSIGVALTQDGGVWTWGEVLGNRPDLVLSKPKPIMIWDGIFGPKHIIRDKPWQLLNTGAKEQTKKK